MAYYLSFTIIVVAALWVVILFAAFFGKLIGTVLPLLKNTRKRLEQSGVIADAVILKMEKTGTLINNRPQVRLQMKVQPDKGRNFVAEISDFDAKTDLAILRTGSVVKVKYNPNNFKELILL